MIKQTALFFLVSIIVTTSGCRTISAGKRPLDMTKTMEQSVVYLHTSFYGYEQDQPWRNKDLSENWACASAVGKYEVITTAWNVANVAFIKARRYGQNEFINAKIKVVDYESNLCLIELDPNEMDEPLKPLVFSEDYRQGAEANFYWLSSNARLYSGRGYLNRTRVDQTTVSYEKRLHYITGNTSARTGIGDVFCIGSTPVGISCWSSDESKESGVIPGELINKFLAEAANKNYKGFGSVGFTVSDLLDPTVRSFLKIPPSVKNGVYVSDVYTLGTGSDVLKKADVILSIDGNEINSNGMFEHPKYNSIHFAHLITSKPVQDKVLFEIWRDGEKKQVQAEVKNFKASEMLIPYHEYDQQPEYVITGGFILQKLTREYLAQWGENWQGQVTPHLYHYYRDLAFKPTPERSDIVILSYVLPTDFNIGYHGLKQIVVKQFNGMEIRSIKDIAAAQKLNPDSRFDVIEFEFDNPPVVIDREHLPEADTLISQSYGIPKLININQ